MNHDEFEERLRATLAAHAARAPESPRVERRVLDEVLMDHHPRTARWRSWGVPLAAAAAVAAVAASVVGVQHYRPSATRHTVPPATQGAPTPSADGTLGSSAASAPTSLPSTGPLVLASWTAVVPGVGGFQASDLTFSSASEAWALGTARTSGCTAAGCAGTLLHTTDGVRWQRVATPSIRLIGSKGCYADCVTGVRFATSKVGYVFGTDLLYMTTDAGSTWQRLSGGAVALETLDDNVIRVSTPCFPGCPLTVQTAPVGNSTWTTRTLPGSIPSMDSRVTLVRAPKRAYLAVYGNPAGGAGSATSNVFESTDDGASWLNFGELCPQTGGGSAGNEVDSTAIAAGDGLFAALCTPRGGSGSFLMSSVANGSSNAHTSTVALGGADGQQLAVAPHAVLATTTSGLYRSTDRGGTWQQVGIPMVDSARWLGFESATDARVVAADGTTIWTTRDAGAHWAAVTFPP